MDPAQLILNHDPSLVLVSRAPIHDIEGFRRRMGWKVPWYSVAEIGFNANFGVTAGFGLNLFLRHGDRVFHTYHTTGRGVEYLGTHWSLLDLTPFGRQEEWEDSPEGLRPGSTAASRSGTVWQWRSTFDHER